MGILFQGGAVTNLQDIHVAGAEDVTGVTAGLNDNAYRRLGGSRRGTELQLWVNGVADAKKVLTTVPDVSTIGVPIRIGGAGVGAGADGLIGGLAEVITIKGTISDADIAKLDAYFKTKWGL